GPADFHWGTPSRPSRSETFSISSAVCHSFAITSGQYIRSRPFGSTTTHGLQSGKPGVSAMGNTSDHLLPPRGRRAPNRATSSDLRSPEPRYHTASKPPSGVSTTQLPWL